MRSMSVSWFESGGNFRSMGSTRADKGRATATLMNPRGNEENETPLTVGGFALVKHYKALVAIKELSGSAA